MGNSGGMAMGNSGGMSGTVMEASPDDSIPPPDGNSGPTFSGPPPGAMGPGAGASRGPRNPGSGDMVIGGFGGSFENEDGTFGFPGNQGQTKVNLTSFIQNNCLSCHAGQNVKGDVRLDVALARDISQNAKLWQQVASSLESGSMPPRTARQPDPVSRMQVVELIREALGNVAEQSYMEQAEIAYANGDYEKAMSLFYAQMITADDSEASQLASHFKLYRPAPSKPDDLVPSIESGVEVKTKIVTRFPIAVGILLKAESGVTDVKPVGVKQMGGASGGEMGSEGGGGPMASGRGSGGRGGAAGGANPNSKLEAFEDLTGEIGAALVAAFESRRSSGNYGTLFSEVQEDYSAGADMVAGAGMMGGRGASGGGFSSGGDETGDGLIGGMSLGGLTDPGGMGPGGFNPGGFGQGGPGAAGPSRPAKTMPGKNLANGLLYLGRADNLNALLKKANEAGSDGLIVFDINATKNARQVVTNTTRFRFLFPSGKVVVASKSIENVELERQTLQGKEPDLVQKQVDQLFDRLDKVLAISDLPTIPAASAMKQLHKLVHSDASPLQTLAEARMYHAKGIIDAAQLETVYQVVLQGNEGVSLAKGTTDDRKMVMQPLLESL